MQRLPDDHLQRVIVRWGMKHYPLHMRFVVGVGDVSPLSDGRGSERGAICSGSPLVWVSKSRADP